MTEPRKPRWTPEQRRARDAAMAGGGPGADALDLAGSAAIGEVARIAGVYLSGRDCHRLEAVLRHGLRQYKRDGVTVPNDLLVLVEEVSDVANEFRTTANGSSAAVKSGRFAMMETVDIEQTAAILGCKARNVRRLIAVGHLPAQKTGGRYLVNRIDVEDYANRSKRTMTDNDRAGLPIPERDALDAPGHAWTALAAETAAEFSERWRDGQLRAAAKLIRKHGASTTGKLPGDVATEVERFLRIADESAERAARFRGVRDGHSTAAVRSEPRTYGPNSPNSYFMDVARAAMPGIHGHSDAVANLERYSRELAVEAKAESPEGRRAMMAAATRGRTRGDEGVHNEQRALSTATGSAGAFTVPIYLQSSFGLYNSFPPAFLEQCSKVPDPGYGMTLNLPSFTSAPTVAEQTSENSAASDSSPGAGYLTSSLVTFTGEVEVSQQLLDRAGPIGMDQYLHDALVQQLDTQMDVYAIGQALATAGTVSGASSFTAAGLFGDIANAKSAMETAAGTKVPATHTFSSTSFVDWLEAQADPNGRPLWLPACSEAVLPIQPSSSGGPPVGFTGERLVGTGTVRRRQHSRFGLGRADPRGQSERSLRPTVRAGPPSRTRDLRREPVSGRAARTA